MEVSKLDSILNSVKDKLGLSSDYEVFDSTIIDEINSAFFILWQLGVGNDPTDPFVIADSSAKWTDFINEGMVESVREYVYIKVKLVFDPPTNSFLVDNLKQKADELEWRMPAAMDEYNSRKKLEGN